MKWLIVVVFANLAPNGEKELYIFTNPTFDDPIVCQSDISNPEVIPLLVDKIIRDEGPRPIERVLCLPEENIKDMMQKYNRTKGESV